MEWNNICMPLTMTIKCLYKASHNNVPLCLCRALWKTLHNQKTVFTKYEICSIVRIAWNLPEGNIVIDGNPWAWIKSQLNLVKISKREANGYSGSQRIMISKVIISWMLGKCYFNTNSTTNINSITNASIFSCLQPSINLPWPLPSTLATH